MPNLQCNWGRKAFPVCLPAIWQSTKWPTNKNSKSLSRIYTPLSSDQQFVYLMESVNKEIKHITHSFNVPLTNATLASLVNKIIITRSNIGERERPNRAEVRWWFSFVFHSTIVICIFACHRHFFVALAEHGKFRACALNIYQRIAFLSWSKTHRPVAVT